MEVRLYLHIKKNNGKRGFAPAAYGKNSKILPKQALMDGQVELHPEGKYPLRYTKGGKQVFEPVGADAHIAVVAKLRKEHLLKASALGANVVIDVEGNRLILAKAIERFLMEKAAHRAEKTCQEFTRGSEPAGPSQERSPSLREYRLWTRREPVPHAGQTEQAQQACNCNWIALSFARRQISSTSEMFGTSVPCLRPAAEIIRAVSFLRLTAPGWKESSNVRMNLYSSQTDLTLTPIDARTLFSTNRDGIANADDPLETNH